MRLRAFHAGLLVRGGPGFTGQNLCFIIHFFLSSFFKRFFDVDHFLSLY